MRGLRESGSSIMRCCRREFGRLLCAALPAAGSFAQPVRPAFKIGGLDFGVETFSFHDLPPAGDAKLIPTLIQDMRDVGLAECEIMSGHVEPMGSYATGWWVPTRRAPGYEKMREEARRWRLSVPMDYYRAVRKQFEAAGLRIYLYNVNF